MSDAGDRRYLGRGYQGAVYTTGEGAARIVVKEPIGRGLARRLRLAMLGHEHRAYQRLAGIVGIPPCLGLRPDGSLALAFVAAEPFHESAPALRDRDAYFAALRDIVLACHRAGVAHGDLKRRGNVLIDAAGAPWVLDFGTAVLARGRGGWLFRLACRMDLNAWIKLKYRRRYDAIAPDDAPYYRPTWVEGLARTVRRGFRKLTGRRWRKARRLRRAGGAGGG